MSQKNRRAYARTLLSQLKTEADFDGFVIDYFIEIKRERFASGMDRKQKINFVQGDMRDLSAFADGSFDAAMAILPRAKDSCGHVSVGPTIPG